MFKPHPRIARNFSAGLSMALAVILFPPTGSAQQTQPGVALQRGVWRLTASSVTASARGLELHNARLVSATTYVVAPYVVLDAMTLSADDAIVHVADWSIAGTRLRISADVDAVEIIPRSARAGQE